MIIGQLTPDAFAFGFFTLLTLGGAFGVAMNRNLVRGVIWLIVSLFGMAGFFVLLSAPFLAAVQVLVYIGAVGILFTFAVMLTRGMTNIRERYNQQWWLSALVSLAAFLLLFFVVIVPVWGNADPITAPLEVATTVDFGISLVDGNQYVLPFEVASLLLTAALVGAIVIAREEE